MTRDEHIEAIEDVLDAFAGDSNISAEDYLTGLEDIQSRIQTSIDALHEVRAAERDG